MISKKQIEALLALEDSTLADLYSAWSEDMWCASWMSDGEPEFARQLVNGYSGRSFPPPDYERGGVAKIREVLRAALEKEETP